MPFPARFLSVLLLLPAFPATAQLRELHIGVNGLTCSQCTRNVEMSLRKLAFVTDVRMDLQHTDGRIMLDEQQPADLHAVARAVKNAGFSMRFLEASLAALPAGATCFSQAGYNFQLVPAPAAASGSTARFLGPDFLPVAEYKKWKPRLVPECPGSKDLYFITRRQKIE